MGWRGTSIKTRIETVEECTDKEGFFRVEEELPLKQGLKHIIEPYMRFIKNCWRGTSIKTRIETDYLQLYNALKLHVEEELPLKQGLKLSIHKK